MTDRPRRKMTAAGGIRLILGFQLLIAVILVGGDLARVLPDLARSPNSPRLTQPVLPGDQTRLYDRRHVPGNPSVPDTGDMPSRLLFSLTDDVLELTGAISVGDAQRFDEWRALRDLPQTVRLHSTGGSVQDAIAIGKQLRAAGMTTLIGAGDVCLSACPYMLAAGTDRQVHTDAYVGVHQHYFGENTILPAFLAVQDIQRGQGEVMAYLDQMGIDLRLMQPALTTPPEEIYILLPEELEEYALATEILR